MKMVYYVDASSVEHYIISYGGGANGNQLSDSLDVQDASEYPDAQTQAVENFLVNKRGIARANIHIAPKPPK